MEWSTYLGSRRAMTVVIVVLIEVGVVFQGARCELVTHVVVVHQLPGLELFRAKTRLDYGSCCSVAAVAKVEEDLLSQARLSRTLSDTLININAAVKAKLPAILSIPYRPSALHTSPRFAIP